MKNIHPLEKSSYAAYKELILATLELLFIFMCLIAPAETEIKNIDIKTNAMDYLFYTDDGEYLHFEFQTTKKKEDVPRFLYYDASLYYKSEKKITTVVVYSSDIKDVVTNLDCGSIKYNIRPFYISDFDGDSKLENIKQKVENNIELTEQEIMTLSFIPLMTTRKSKSDITLESLEVAKNINNNKEKNNCLMLLYALFDKFGDEFSKKKFKEAVSMTDVGKMIYEEGMEEGIEKGKVDLLIRQLIKKFKIVPEDYKKQLMTLPQETIEIIGTEIFDMKSVEELKKYFNL